MRAKQFTLVCIILPAGLLAQDKVLGDAIEHFKGAADEARKANPLLAAGTGEGLSKIMTGLVAPVLTNTNSPSATPRIPDPRRCPRSPGYWSETTI